MKQRAFTLLVFLLFTFVGIESLKAQQNNDKQEKTIFIWGGDINTKFVQYVVDLTKKENPKICYLQFKNIELQSLNFINVRIF